MFQNVASTDQVMVEIVEEMTRELFRECGIPADVMERVAQTPPGGWKPRRTRRVLTPGRLAEMETLRVQDHPASSASASPTR